MKFRVIEIGTYWKEREVEAKNADEAELLARHEKGIVVRGGSEVDQFETENLFEKLTPITIKEAQDGIKLTDDEIVQVKAFDGDIAEAQEAKKQAYIKAGGIILNPDALLDLYKALKALIRRYGVDCSTENINQARKALAKVEKI